MDAIETLENSVERYTAGNELYQEYYDHWKYMLESFVGSQEYENAQHLMRYSLETAGEYGARLKSTPLQNHCASIVDVYTSFIFKTPPTRDLGRLADDPRTNSILQDADMDGRSFNSFMKDVATYNSVFGQTWIIVAKPNTGAVTIADEIANGSRPYLNLITPMMMLDWRWQRQPSGAYELEYIKYVEEVTGKTKTIKEWSKDIIRTVVVNDDTIQYVEEVENGLGKIPAVCSYNKRGIVRGIGVSDIADIADTQRYIYNLISEIEQTIRLDSHPSLAVTENTIISAGAGSVIQMPDDLDPGLKPYILQSSGANITQILATIDMCVESIDKMANTGAVRAVESKTMSGVAMQTEFVQLASKLAEKADSLELTEEHIWRLISEYMGYPYEANIDYPHQYNIRDNNADLEFLMKARAAGVTNSEFQEEINKRIVELVVDDPQKLNEIYQSMEETDFEIHDMINSQTGETVTVTSQSQHVDLIARGFVELG